MLELAKKPTRFAGTMPFLNSLGSKCTGEHSHVAVLGGVKVNNKWVRRSQIAGSYPLQLCQAYAKAFERSFA